MTYYKSREDSAVRVIYSTSFGGHLDSERHCTKFYVTFDGAECTNPEPIHRVSYSAQTGRLHRTENSESSFHTLLCTLELMVSYCCCCCSKFLRRMFCLVTHKKCPCLQSLSVDWVFCCWNLGKRDNDKEGWETYLRLLTNDFVSLCICQGCSWQLNTKTSAIQFTIEYW